MCFQQGLSRKPSRGDLFDKRNYGIPPRKQHGKILEDSRRLSTKADPEGIHVWLASPTCRLVSPTYRLAGLWVPLVSLHFESRFPTAIEIQSSPFIQVSLIRGLKIDALAYLY